MDVVRFLLWQLQILFEIAIALFIISFTLFFIFAAVVMDLYHSLCRLIIEQLQLVIPIIEARGAQRYWNIFNAPENLN